MHEGLGSFLFKAVLLGAILLLTIFNFVQIESLERRLRDLGDERSSQPATASPEASAERSGAQALPTGATQQGNLVILPSGIVLVPTTAEVQATSLAELVAGDDAAALQAQLAALEAHLDEAQVAQLRALIAAAQEQPQRTDEAD